MQGVPRLIDRERLLADPESSGPRLSLNGKYIELLTPWKNSCDIWVRGTGQPFSSARLMTTEIARPIAAFRWAPGSRFILQVKDSGGDENFNVYAVDRSAATAPGAGATPSRSLTNQKGVRMMLFSAPKADPDESPDHQSDGASGVVFRHGG
jgi:hypothetical protein